MKYSNSPVLLVAFVLTLFTSATVRAQSTNPSLSAVLNPDGSVKANVTGSFDPSGFRMSYGPNGEPRFVDDSQPLGGCTPDSWDTSFSVNGAENTVYAVVPDGAGNVYIGGRFSAVGNVPASRIAKWNGTTWSELGSGIGGGIVLSIAVSGSDVYAAGDFTSAGGLPANRVAKWDGNAWSAMGTGVGVNLSDWVNAIVVSGSNVYAGGKFVSVGGSPNYIARWDGTSWVSMGTGVDGEVLTVAVSGTDVYAGGFFHTAGGVPAAAIAKWDGVSWSPIGAGFVGRVQAIAVSGTDVYAGGPTMPGSISKWNGSSWESLGTGIGGPSVDIRTIIASGTDVYVGGTFTTAGGLSANRIAKWNGSQWSSLGVGVGDTTSTGVNAIAVIGQTVMVGGFFPTAGGSIAKNVAVFSSNTWTAFNGTALDSGAGAIAVSGTDVYVGGSFIMAGSVTANRIVKWNNLTNSWSSLGSGANGPISAIAVAGNKVYVGGSFSSIGGVSANNIAVWNGTTWAPLGTGVNSSVFVIGVKGEDVYAAGNFLTAGGVTANRIAKWNGTSWSGLNSSILPTTVTSIAFMGNDIYVATTTTTIANPAYFTKYDGTSWTALGADLGDRGVGSLAVIGTDVYVAGAFTFAGSLAVNRIAKWNGSSWSALGGGLPQPSGQPGVVRLAVSGPNLIAVGDFTVAGGGPADRVAKWNGTSWSPLGHGLNNTSGTVAAAGGDIFVGGNFTTAGCNMSPYFARWRETVWTGSTNTDWHTGTNWGSGSVPATNGSVTISSSDASISSADVTMSSLIVTNGRTLTIGAGRTLTVNGTLDLTNGTLVGPGNLVVNDLSLNGGNVTGLGSTVVNGNLLLGSGSITGGPVTITSCRASALAGGSASFFLTSPLTRCVNSSGTYRFPVGTGSVYAPVELANVAGSGNFTVDPKSGAHPGATGLPNNRLQRWWDMTNGGITQADVTFTYADPEVVGRENWYRVYTINGGAAAQLSTAINTTTNRVTVAGVTSFSGWTLAEGTPAPRILQGRLTNPSGRGAFHILVSLTDDQGNIRYAVTNPAGYYRFQDVQTFRVYTVKVSSKKYTFPTPQRTVEFDEFTTTINFVSSDN